MASKSTHSFPNHPELSSMALWAQPYDTLTLTARVWIHIPVLFTSNMIYVLKSKGISSPIMTETGRQQHRMLFSVTQPQDGNRQPAREPGGKGLWIPGLRGIRLVPCGYFWAIITDKVPGEWRENYGVSKCSGRDLLEPVFKQESLRNHILKSQGSGRTKWHCPLRVETCKFTSKWGWQSLSLM